MNTPAKKQGSATSRSLSEALCDHNAEAAVLGVLFLEEAVNNIHQLREEYFDNKMFRQIFIICSELYDENIPIDLVTVAGKLQGRNKYSPEMVEALLAVSDYAVTDGAFPHHLKIVKNKYQARSLTNTMNRVEEMIKGNVETDKIANSVMDDILHIYKDAAGDGIADINAANMRVLNELDEHLSDHRVMVRTWYNDVDHLMGSVSDGSLVVIGGRPGMGKSVLAVNLALNNAINNVKVGIVNYEMSTEDTTIRMLSNLSRAPFTTMIRTSDNKDDAKTESLFKSITHAMDILARLPIYQDDNPRGDLANLLSIVTNMATVHNCRVIIVDYLQLVTAAGYRDQRVLELGAITRALKSIARRFKIVIILLSQLNRSLENRQDKRPHLADLRESGNIEQDADLVLFTYRDEYYNPGTISPGIMELIIAKNRHGKLGTVELYYEESYSLIGSLEKYGGEGA